MWNLSTSLGLIQNLSALSHYTEAYHVCIFHTKFISLRHYKCSSMNRIQEEMTEKGRFLCPSKLNEGQLSAIDQSQNFLFSTLRMWATCSLCLRIISMIVFDLLC